MLQIDQTRQDFEQWYSDEGKNPETIVRSKIGEYQFMSAQASWIAWAACALAAKGEKK